MKTKKSSKGIPLNSSLVAKYISKLKPLPEHLQVIVELVTTARKLEAQVKQLQAQIRALMRSLTITTRQ